METQKYNKEACQIAFYMIKHFFYLLIVCLLLFSCSSSKKLLGKPEIPTFQVTKRLNPNFSNRICAEVRFIIKEISTDTKLDLTLISINNKYFFYYRDNEDIIFLGKGTCNFYIKNLMYHQLRIKNLEIDPRYDYLIEIKLCPITEPLN